MNFSGTIESIPFNHFTSRLLHQFDSRVSAGRVMEIRVSQPLVRLMHGLAIVILNKSWVISKRTIRFPFHLMRGLEVQ